MGNLEFLRSVDGKPEPLKSDEWLDFGEYDIAIGSELDFYIKNPNNNLVANVSDLKTTGRNCVLDIPAEIQPEETVKCSIKIMPVGLATLDGFNYASEDDIPANPIELSGHIDWRRSHYGF